MITDTQMRFRKLRIVWSIGCGIFCVLLIVLWVRSYWWVNQAQYTISNKEAFAVVTSSGGISAAVMVTRSPIVSSFYTAKLTSDELKLNLRPRWRFNRTPTPQRLKCRFGLLPPCSGPARAFPGLRGDSLFALC
jgi:hypothetical protein